MPVLAAGCVSATERRANRALDEGDYAGAAAELRRAAEADPDNPTRFIELGHVEQLGGRTAHARQAFERAAALRPGDARIRVRIAITFELEHEYDRARAEYRRAIAMAPGDAYPYRVLGTRLLRWGEPERAIELLARSLDLDPAHAETWNALGLSRYHAHDLPGAERTFRRGIALHPDHRGLRLGLGALLVNARRFGEALAVYDEVVDRWPRFAAAHVGRAILLHELGRTEDAEDAFERAVRVADDPRPYRARLMAYRSMIGR